MRLKIALCLVGVVFLAAGCTGAAAPEHGKPLPTKAPPKASVRDAAEFHYN